MNVPDYVTKEEVRRVCARLGIRDWTRLKEARVLPREAGAVLRALKVRGMRIPPETFRAGLEVELEHGTRYPDANVTNNHPLLTGRIVLAHLKETMDYYQRLDVAELEGDLLKAMKAGKAAKAASYYRRLLQARLVLGRAEAESIG